MSLLDRVQAHKIASFCKDYELKYRLTSQLEKLFTRAREDICIKAEKALTNATNKYKIVNVKMGIVGGNYKKYFPAIKSTKE
jgi:hypothetical protein